MHAYFDLIPGNNLNKPTKHKANNMAKSSPSQLADPTPPAPTPQAILGLVLDVNSTPVTINAGTITAFKTKGIELGITNPVDLGTVSDMITYLNSTFSISIPTGDAVKDLPSPLGDILQKVEGLDVTIVKAHVKLPPTMQPDGTTKIDPPLPNTYTLVMSVLESGTDDVLKIGPLGLKGAVIGVTNEPTYAGS